MCPVVVACSLKSITGRIAHPDIITGASSAATVLQVAWGFLLAQYLETDKVVFGETWSLRNRLPSIGATVGPFLSVLPVPFHACGSPHDMLRSQSDFLKKAREHLLIHPRAVRKLLNRTEGQTLYPAIFNFIADQTIETPIDDQIPWTRTEDSFDPVVEHPIAVNITLSQDDALQFELFAQAQIIDQSHLELLTQQFDAIVRVILDFPDTSQEAIVSHCPMRLLSLTVAGPSPAVDRALTGQPTDWVDHYAGLHPHWPAARAFNHVEEDASASEEWTYSDLYRAYRRVATFIGHIGSSRHTIAVCMDRRLEAYAIILGIWHSGNVYLPIAEDLPGERKSFLIHDGAATLLFTTASLAASFPDTAKICLIICVDEPNYLKVCITRQLYYLSFRCTNDYSKRSLRYPRILVHQSQNRYHTRGTLHTCYTRPDRRDYPKACLSVAEIFVRS